jgi:hypothetical protein
MTNFEKYKEEILDLNNRGLMFGVVDDEPRGCIDIKDCEGCQFNPYPYREFTLENCIGATVEWLYQEPKQKLTKDEFGFLMGIGRNSQFKIYRNVNMALLLVDEEYFYEMTINPLYFPFIQFGDAPRSVEELLKLEVEK